MGMGFLRTGIAIDSRKASWIPGRNGCERGSDAGVILRAAAANPVWPFHIARSQPRGGDLRCNFDQQCKIGTQTAAADPVQREQIIVGQTAAAALIG